MMAGCEATATIDAGWGPERVQELRRLYEPLRRFAGVVGRWDVEPDDLVQAAFTNVLVRPAGEIRDLGAYLRRTIANLAANERLTSTAPA